MISSATKIGAHSGRQHQTHCLRIIKKEDGVFRSAVSIWFWKTLGSTAGIQNAGRVASEFFQPVFPIALNCPKVTTTSTGRSETGETGKPAVVSRCHGFKRSSTRCLCELQIRWKSVPKLRKRRGWSSEAGHACLASTKLVFSSWHRKKPHW